MSTSNNHKLCNGLNEPVFNTDSIPLTVDGSFPMEKVFSNGEVYTVGNTKLQMNVEGLDLLFNGEVVWNIKLNTPSETAYSKFDSLGNLCVYGPNQPSICTNSFLIGGSYLNILPEGSYGRQWGIVIQNAAGKMVWGRFGLPINEYGNMPLIPGNFIERGSSFSSGFITNGEDYLSMNQRENEAIAFYHNVNPIDQSQVSVWKIGKEYGKTYTLYFSEPDWNICIYSVNQNQPIFCNDVIADQKYLVVPLKNDKDIPNDNGFWSWIVLSSDMNIVYTQSNRALPVFNALSIPLTKDGNRLISPGTFLSVGSALNVGNSQLVLKDTGLQLLFKGEPVWVSNTFTKSSEKALTTFGLDGNLCVSSSSDVVKPEWCSYTQNLGGQYFNILPEGSYGRQWGIVIQNAAGKMVWGKFGPLINKHGIMPLIPGNYIDKEGSSNGIDSISNGFITNGRDYLGVNRRSDEALGLYYKNSPENSDKPTESDWSIKKVDTTKSYKLYFSDNSNICVGEIDSSTENPIWCNFETPSLNIRYLIIPLYNDQFPDDAYWNLLVLDENKNIIDSKNNRKNPVYDEKAIPLTVGGYISSVTYSAGLGVGQSIAVGNVKFAMTSIGFRILYNNEPVWIPYTLDTPNNSAIVMLKSEDGNLCLRIAGTSIWCTNTFGFGGKYLNVLPEGSYGRKWGVVIQDEAGKMVWGRFGPSISGAGVLPLIPGSYIDRLDPNNSILKNKNIITNGRDYLAMNQRTNEAIGVYSGLSPSNDFEVSVWSKNKQDTTKSYNLYFNSTDSNVCVGADGTGTSVPIWCNSISTPSNQRYVVVPQNSNIFPNDDGDWGFLVLDGNKKVVDIISKKRFPVNDEKSIPLSPNGYIKSDRFLFVGQEIVVNNVKFVMTAFGFRILYNNEPVWVPYTLTTANNNAVAFFRSNGNLCLRSSTTAGSSLWCNNAFTFNGLYLNVLPEGSYGRQWGVVIQDAAGKMIWGRFGSGISSAGTFPLIPGSYIDRLDTKNAVLKSIITNGKDYLAMNQRTNEAVGLYSGISPSNDFEVSVWSINKQNTTKSYYLYFKNDSKVCVGEDIYETTKASIWCNSNSNKNIRYVMTPLSLFDSNTDLPWNWVILDDQKNIIESISKEILPVFDKSSIPLTSGANVGINTNIYVGSSMSVGNTKLVMTNKNLELLYKDQTVWTSNNLKNPNSKAIATFDSNGNLCVSTSPSVAAEWCVYTQNLGGKYLNILPEGSYGRQWGIVIQSAAGKMVWGRFGPAISDVGNNPLIPGNFIDKLDSNNKLDSSQFFITNGLHYLAVNRRSDEALGFYFENSPENDVIKTDAQLSFKKGDNSKSYQLYFKDSDVCLSPQDSVSTVIWCSEKKDANQRYIILPLYNDYYTNYDNFWMWGIYSSNLQLIFSNSSRPLPVFDQISIPLTKDGYKSGGIYITVNTSIAVGSTKFVMTSTGFRILYKGEPVWDPYTLSYLNNDAIAFFKSDGNICLRESTDASSSLWCTNAYTTNPVLNVLPEGSYGRQWGVVIQNASGKMVWGRFGPAISSIGTLPLIPGSYIDRLDPNTFSSGYITNGRDYLSINPNSTMAIRFETNEGENHSNNITVWSIKKTVSTKTYKLYFNSSDLNLCVSATTDNTAIWCNNVRNKDQRYVVVPFDGNELPTGKDFWGWVTLSSNKKITYIYSNKEKPVYDEKSIPLSLNNYIESGNVLTVNDQPLKVGSSILRMTASGLEFIHDGIVVYKPYTISPSNNNAYAYLKTDGNLCLRESTTATTSLWCANAFTFKGKYLNILPEGSYGRQWGIVIQTEAGKMIWGRFGPAVSSAGKIPLIPGSFIDRLDPNNSILDGNSTITNGIDYLAMNQRTNEAIGLYSKLSPSNTDQVSVWSKTKQDTKKSYSLYFKDDSNLCLGIIGAQAMWCNNLNNNQRYVVVPLPSLGLPTDDDFWGWIVMNNDKTITDIKSNKKIPTYDKNSIPLNEYVSTSSTFTVGYSLGTGDTKFVLTDQGFRILYKGKVVWNPYTYTATSTLVGSFSSDGNLCFKKSSSVSTNIYCTESNNLGGNNLNILVEGSYGRQWGVVIQNGGKMVWGRFGPAISNMGLMPLVPGNYIDKDSYISSFITNGRDYLAPSKTDDGYFSFGLFYNKNPILYPINPSFEFKPKIEDYRNYFPNFGFSMRFVNDRLCVYNIPFDSTLWCSNRKNQKYVVVPLPSNDNDYGWVSLDDKMVIVDGKVFSNIVQTNKIAIPTSSSNDFTVSGQYTSLSFSNTLKNLKITLFDNSFVNISPVSKYGLLNSQSFGFYREMTCGSSSCSTSTCKDIRLSLSVPRNTDKFSEYLAYYFGFSGIVPDGLLMDINYNIIDTTKLYNITHYYPSF